MKTKKGSGAEEVVKLNKIKELEGEYPGNIQEEREKLQDELHALSKEGKLRMQLEPGKEKMKGYVAIGVREPSWIEGGKYLAFYYNPAAPQVVQKDFICDRANTRRVVPREEVDPNIRYLSHCRLSSRGRAARLLIRHLPSGKRPRRPDERSKTAKD